MTPKITWTVEKAIRFIRGYTVGLTSQQQQAVAERMVATGECVWHAAAQVTGKRCWCSDCMPEVTRI